MLVAVLVVSMTTQAKPLAVAVVVQMPQQLLMQLAIMELPIQEAVQVVVEP
jgi:hypothetical protein